MAISPCNTLNVKTIRISQLASVSSNNLNGSDVIYISQYDNLNSIYYSKKTTLSDLTDFFNLRAKFSGSFSGSYWGRIISKNTDASGSFSGSHYGSLVSKNTTATGSFNGVFYGNATTATDAITSDTSSYLLQTNQNTTREIGYFDGTRLKSATGLTFDNNISGRKLLNLSSSLNRHSFVIAGRGSLGFNISDIFLANLNNNNTYPNVSAWSISCYKSGSLSLIAPIGSYHFSSPGIVARSTSNECFGMVQMRNGFYFWPYMNTNTPSRDGAIGIGVQPPNEPTGSFQQYLRAKFQINMFSGSGEGPWDPKATVENRSTAILVNYGSGSVNTGFSPKFFVSASGNTYVAGTLTIDKPITSSLAPSGVGEVLPANVKWIPINVGGVIYKLPLYNN